MLSGESNPNHESIQKRLRIVQRELIDSVSQSSNKHILSEGLDISKLELLKSEKLTSIEEPERLK